MEKRSKLPETVATAAVFGAFAWFAVELDKTIQQSNENALRASSDAGHELGERDRACELAGFTDEERLREAIAALYASETPEATEMANALNGAQNDINSCD